jgi:cystathionine beta-lyase/cystathionine gamma-synthase
MVTFDAGSEARARAFFDAAELIRRAASLASVDSLMSLPILTSHHGFPIEELRKHGITPGLVRLSIGIEDADDLIADIRRALDAAGG